MSRNGIEPPRRARRLTRQSGHIVTPAGATPRSSSTRLPAWPIAFSGKSDSAGPPQHQVRRPACAGSPDREAGRGEERARLVDDALVRARRRRSRAAATSPASVRPHRRPALREHLQVAADLDVEALDELRVDGAQHRRRVRVDRDRLLTPCLRKRVGDLLRVPDDDLVGAEVPGERARVEVVLVQVAELDPGLAEQDGDVAEDAVVPARAAPGGERGAKRAQVDERG